MDNKDKYESINSVITMMKNEGFTKEVIGSMRRVIREEVK